MRELALFAGAGGGLLGSHLLGWRTVCAVELDDYARGVLLARQNDGALRPFPIWDDVRTFDGLAWRGLVDVVSGGFPCTDVSIARAIWGRDGINGRASGLWREFLRIVDECQPLHVFGENSPELRRQGLDVIVRALAARGFVSRWATVAASDLGFPHQRKRLWFLATNTDRARLERHARNDDAKARRAHPAGSFADADLSLCPFCGYRLAIPDPYGCPNCLGEGLDDHLEGEGVQPGVVGMDDGLANRVDRLRAVGNGQVPAMAAHAWQLLST